MRLVEILLLLLQLVSKECLKEEVGVSRGALQGQEEEVY